MRPCGIDASTGAAPAVAVGLAGCRCCIMWLYCAWRRTRCWRRSSRLVLVHAARRAARCAVQPNLQEKKNKIKILPLSCTACLILPMQALSATLLSLLVGLVASLALLLVPALGSQCDNPFSNLVATSAKSFGQPLVTGAVGFTTYVSLFFFVRVHFEPCLSPSRSLKCPQRMLCNVCTCPNPRTEWPTSILMEFLTLPQAAILGLPTARMCTSASHQPRTSARSQWGCR